MTASRSTAGAYAGRRRVMEVTSCTPQVKESSKGRRCCPKGYCLQSCAQRHALLVSFLSEVRNVPLLGVKNLIYAINTPSPWPRTGSGASHIEPVRLKNLTSDSFGLHANCSFVYTRGILPTYTYPHPWTPTSAKGEGGDADLRAEWHRQHMASRVSPTTRMHQRTNERYGRRREDARQNTVHQGSQAGPTAQPT